MPPIEIFFRSQPGSFINMKLQLLVLIETRVIIVVLDLNKPLYMMNWTNTSESNHINFVSLKTIFYKIGKESSNDICTKRHQPF